MHTLYNGEVTIKLGAGHRYTIFDRGERQYLESVTTHLNRVTNKSALIQWAVDLSMKENDRLAHQHKKEVGGSIGTIVHAACEKYIGDVLLKGRGTDVIGLSDPQASLAFEAFLEWDTSLEPEYLFSEKLLYSRQHQYTGMADVAFILNGKRYLGDFKTSNPRYKKGYSAYPEHFLQVAAYDVAHSEESKEEPFDAYMIIYITKTGQLHTFETNEVDKWKSGWLYALELSKLIKSCG